MKITVYSAGKTVISEDDGTDIAERLGDLADSEAWGIRYSNYAVATKSDGTELWRGWLTGDPDAPPPAEADPAKRRVTDLETLESVLRLLAANWDRMADEINAEARKPEAVSDKPHQARLIGRAAQARYCASWLREALTPRSVPAPGSGSATASALRNAKKLAIALDALREIRERCADSGQGLAIMAHARAETALERISAVGPSLAEMLETLPDGDEREADEEFMADAASLDSDFDDCEPEVTP